MFYPYIQFLQDTGIKIKPFGVVWETTRFNRKFRRLSQIKPAFLRWWFQLGANISLMCMIPAIFLVCYSFLQALSVTAELTQTSTDKATAVDDSQVDSSNSNIIHKHSINSPILMPIVSYINFFLNFNYCL